MDDARLLDWERGSTRRRELNGFRRLMARYERRADIHPAFLSLGCALVCWQALLR